MWKHIFWVTFLVKPKVLFCFGIECYEKFKAKYDGLLFVMGLRISFNILLFGLPYDGFSGQTTGRRNI
jgi:hypothetical protein